MKKKKLYEMTPEEQAALTPEERENALFEVIAEPTEGISQELIYPLIRAHAKEKLLREKAPDCIFYRFFYCDLEESFEASQKIFKAVVQEKHEEAQSSMREILNLLINYAAYYANLCDKDPQKIIKDVSIFIDTLEFTKNDKGEFCYVLYAPISKYLKMEDDDSIRLGWALQVGGNDPANAFEEIYGELTAAVEIALLALWEIFAPREAFTSVYKKIAERALQYGKPEKDLTEYTEKNKDFDFWLDDTKDTLNYKIKIHAAQEPDEPQADLISIAARRAKKIQYPTDKVNFMAFNIPGRKDINGQLRFDGEFKINVGKRGEPPAIVLYNIQFNDNDVSISQKLDPYDKRVQIAAGTLWKECGEYITLKQLYHAMGNDSTPGAPSFERLLNSMKKQLTAEIQITNEDEARKQKRRTKFVYSGALLPYETITAEVNGKIQDGVIHLLREPPLIEFARQRKQITTIPRAALAIPLNQTNDNLAIEDYIIERINMMKHDPKTSRKILIKTIKEHCQITAKNQRVREKIETILTYFVKINFIKGYNADTEAFELDI